jgi:hypothetical protein
MKYERAGRGSEVSLSVKKAGDIYTVNGTFKTKRALSEVSFIWDNGIKALLMQDVDEGGSLVSEYRQSVFISNMLSNKRHFLEFLGEVDKSNVKPESAPSLITISVNIGKLKYTRSVHDGTVKWLRASGNEYVRVENDETLIVLEELYNLNGGE